MAHPPDSAVVALDQGTTGTTAIVFGPEGEVLGRAYAEITQHYPSPGWVEHDAEEIWQTSRRVLAQAIADSGTSPQRVRAIGITNQRETTVLWDRKTGHPVYRAIVWQSRQTAGVCERLKAEGHEPLFHERTGLVLDPYFSGSKIAWLLERDPKLRARAEAGEIAFGTIDSWLVYRLTGGRVHVTDHTNASRTLLYNLATRGWDDDLLTLFGVPREALPTVVPSSGVCAETAAEPFGSGIPIAGIAGDQQAALFGQGGHTPGAAKNTYGTGAFLLMRVGDRVPDTRGRVLTTMACDARGGPALAVEGAIFVAGAAVQWLRDGLGIIASAAETEALARSVADTGGVVFVPALVGLGAPYWEAEARGTIVGLTRGTTRAHLARASLEAMAYATTGVPLRSLRVDGGAAANDWLMAFQATVLGVPVERPDVVESTALGAAGLAGLAVGVWRDAAAFGSTRTYRAFEPDPTQGHAAAAGYHAWERAVRATLAWAREATQ
jgi:glycerol kinase